LANARSRPRRLAAGAGSAPVGAGGARSAGRYSEGAGRAFAKPTIMKPIGRFIPVTSQWPVVFRVRGTRRFFGGTAGPEWTRTARLCRPLKTPVLAAANVCGAPVRTPPGKSAAPRRTPRQPSPKRPPRRPPDQPRGRPVAGAPGLISLGRGPSRGRTVPQSSAAAPADRLARAAAAPSWIANAAEGCPMAVKRPHGFADRTSVTSRW
jgi:hypothetical protein